MARLFIPLIALFMLCGMNAQASIWPRANGSWSRLSNGGAITGNIKVPIIFVNFQTAGSDDENEIPESNQNGWLTSLNSTTGFGGTQYFSDMSYGKVNVTFEKVGVYSANGSASSYSNTYANLVSTAVSSFSSVDWSQYDSNGDGFVDMVLLIYAGHADGDYYSSGRTVSGIYPQSGWLDVNSGNGTTISGISNLKFSRYLFVNDLASGSANRDGLSTALHELGHALFDLPDYYNRSNGTPSYGSNMGMWDTMDYGLYLASLYGTSNPVPGLSAFSRMLNGWLTPIELTQPLSCTLPPITEEAKCYMIKESDTHYYLLEARHAVTGSWDNGLASGLIVTEVNESGISNFILNHGSNDGKVKVLPANNVVYGSGNYTSNLSTQPFGTNNVTEISSSFGAIFSTKTVTNIKVNADGSVSFDFMGGGAEDSNLSRLSFETSNLRMKVGDTKSNAATCIPSGYDGTITYESSNTEVAIVDATGNVTAVSVGTATITATAPTTDNYEGSTASFVVTVSAPSVSGDYSIVTSVDELEDGDEVIFVCEKSSVAMGDMTSSGYNYDAVSVTVEDQTYSGMVNESGVPYSYEVIKNGDKFNFLSTKNYTYLSDYVDGNYQYAYLSDTPRDYGLSIDATTGIASITLVSDFGNEMFLTYYDGYDDFEYSMTSWGDKPNFAIYKKLAPGADKKVAMAPKQKAVSTSEMKIVYRASTAAPVAGSEQEFLILSQNGWWALGGNASASVGGPGATGTYTEDVNVDGNIYSFKLTADGYLYNVGLEKYFNASGTAFAYGDEGSTVWTLSGIGSSSKLSYKVANGSRTTTYYLTSPGSNAGAFGRNSRSSSISIFVPSDSKEEVVTTVYVDEEPISISVGTVEGYATYYNAADAYKMPEGLKGCFITDATEEGGALTPEVRYEAGEIVPAGTPLLLMGEKGDYSAVLYEKKAGAAEKAIIYGDSDSNQLEGGRSADDMTLSARNDVYYYKLTYDADTKLQLGFYWGAEDGGAFKMAKGTTAYLAVSKSAAAKGFILSNDIMQPTAIATTISAGTENDAIYTLTGVRLSNTSTLPAGIYVRGGKKVFINK